MKDKVECIFCGQMAIPTDEHVIPEFAGGSLIIPLVCKTCNDKMGSDFEGPASQSIIYRLPRSLTENRKEPHFRQIPDVYHFEDSFELSSSLII